MRAMTKNDHDVCASADDMARVLEHVALHRQLHYIGESHAKLGATLELDQNQRSLRQPVRPVDTHSNRYRLVTSKGLFRPDELGAAQFSR
jgi:hypothetical protein